MLASLIRWLHKDVVSTDVRHYMKTAISQEVRKGAQVILFYVDIVRLTELEQRLGDQAAKRVLQILEKTLFNVSRELFEIKGKLLGIQRLWGDDFAIYVSFRQRINEEECRMLSLTFQERIEWMLNQEVQYVNRVDLRVHMGYARIPGQDIVKEMYTSVKHAVQMAKYGLTSDTYAKITQFQHLLDTEAIQMHFMPIVSLRSGEPLGWEALARGPQGSPFYAPAQLFGFAEETDNLFRLEQICRKRALEHVRFLQPHQKLFINLDPRAIDDPYLLRGNLFKLLQDCGLTPENIVLEVTERHAITNYEVFRRLIEEFRKKGYQIAVDDAGAGYSSLESIAEIYPDFIKLDMSLIRNIDVDPLKQALLETFVQFADKVKCKIIAEGIEHEQELQTLIELGVPYGQGFFLGKPAKGMIQTTGAAMNVIRSLGSRQQRMARRVTGTPDVYDIMTKTICVQPTTKVRAVHQIFEQNGKIDSVVVVEDGKPVGLIMRTQLFQILGGQYGISLFYERPVSAIMNRNPLIVCKTEKIDNVSKQAMSRDTLHLYDVLIIVDEHQQYLGIVTVQSLLDKMATIKLEWATFANPLTGLPGNLQIERELQGRLQRKDEFIVVYCDLDRFKWFNDRYGFEVGDQIICKTAELLRESIEEEGHPSDFLGHIGGDDMIILARCDRIEAITRYIAEHFDSHINQTIAQLCEQELSAPILTLSMAGVWVTQGKYTTVEQISKQAAVVKKRAKEMEGTVFVSDDGPADMPGSRMEVRAVDSRN